MRSSPHAALLLTLTGCVAGRPYNLDTTELLLDLDEGQTEASLEVVLDIREGVLPDPEVYLGDELSIELHLAGPFDLDVHLDGQEKPAKGGHSEEDRFFSISDLAPACDPSGACQHVVQIDVHRTRTAPDTLQLWASWELWTTQAAITFFPSAATEQEVRLRVFER